ncbi:MAG: hypothetical protein KKH12_15910 [Gammaproteobacteria bacterium]|nr:hypothetical protein [Gammaproteobacteria bacterium]
MRLPAMTLVQPWASLVVSGSKTVENRGFRPGDWMLGRELAIHAGRRYDDMWEDVRGQQPGGLARQLRKRAHAALKIDERAEGLIGIVRVMGWVDDRPDDGDLVEGRIFEDGQSREMSYAEICKVRRSEWVQHGPPQPWPLIRRNHPVWWLLGDARCVSCPVEQRGWPGMFRLTDEVEAELRRALA